MPVEAQVQPAHRLIGLHDGHRVAEQVGRELRGRAKLFRGEQAPDLGERRQRLRVDGIVGLAGPERLVVKRDDFIAHAAVEHRAETPGRDRHAFPELGRRGAVPPGHRLRRRPDATGDHGIGRMHLRLLVGNGLGDRLIRPGLGRRATDRKGHAADRERQTEPQEGIHHDLARPALTRPRSPRQS
jgi:hypothetical protein